MGQKLKARSRALVWVAKFIAMRSMATKKGGCYSPGDVILPRKDYEQLRKRANEANLPPYPKPNADGNYPALEYLRVSIARDIIRDRLAMGLTQKELAKRAGVRVETLCRIETGKHTASTATIDKIDRALTQSARKRKNK